MLLAALSGLVTHCTSDPYTCVLRVEQDTPILYKTCPFYATPEWILAQIVFKGHLYF